MEQLLLTREEKISLSTTEISERIREELKDFKGCVFSVTTEYFSMGSAVHISLMKADFKVIRDITEISEDYIKHLGSGYTREDIGNRQKERYHQLNQFTLRGDFNLLEWCNGVFLTEAGHNLLKKVVHLSDTYNYDNSDSQSDYFDVNFYLEINIGRWNKPFIQPEI
jgi:hypothetical protein